MTDDTKATPREDAPDDEPMADRCARLAVNGTHAQCADALWDAAALIRAQARELDALRAECSKWHAEASEQVNRADRAEAERDALRVDAERYRWLRGDAPAESERWPRWTLQRWDGSCWHSLERAALDAAIDAALAAKEKS